MRRTFLKGLVASAVASVALGGAALAQDAAAFYKDNVIKFIVPYNPGGGYDEYARMIAPYMEKYTGARVDIENVPGSGGMKGAVEIFKAPADGTYIGIINGSAMVTNQLAEIEGATYKVGQYNYLGRIVADARVFVVGTQTGIESYEDIINGMKPIVVGATGLGGSTYVDAVIVGKVFDIDQNVIPGFDRSGDVRTAIIRGDVTGMWGSLGSALSGIQDGDLKMIMHGEKKSVGALEGVPSIYDIAATMDDTAGKVEILEAWEALSAVGRPVATPPGVPDDRLAFLREAFDKSMNDPDFIAEATNTERELSYLSGADMAVVAKSATELTSEINELFVKAIRGEF